MARSTHTQGAAARYLAAALLSLLCIWWLNDLSHADLRYPLVSLTGDVLGTQAAYFKGQIDNAWYLKNHWLGAPFGANYADIPDSIFLVSLACKLLTFVTKNSILIRNILTIGSYPLVTVTALYAMRRLGVRYVIALVASLLYAFATYHHMRITGHFALGLGYFTIPIATLLALRLFEHLPLFLEVGPKGSVWRLQHDRHTLLAALWCVVIGTTGMVYYVCFSCLLFVVAGFGASAQRRSLLPLVRSACLSGLTTLSMVVSMLPYLLNNWQHGKAATFIRSPRDAEIYGLKLSLLFIPGAGHRIPALKKLADFYCRSAPLVTENRMEYLGIVGALGFLVLVAVLLNSESAASRLKRLSVFNIAMVLVGTIGGFSSLLSYLVTDMIRSYNRVSIYIAFFSLLALALLGERAAQRWATSRTRNLLFGAGLLGILVGGLLDQHLVSVDYALLKKAYDREAAFIGKIERSLPANSSIFQYPYASFPEHGPMGQLEDYGDLMPYVFSNTLRWSAGAVRGRRGDAWSASVAGMPPDQAVDTLVQAGFSGIYVAREAYGDFGKGLEASLKQLLGPPTITSAWGHAAFYSLVQRAQERRAALGDQEFERRRTEVLSPMYLGWLDGCYPRESFQGAPRIWCQAKAQFVIHNPSRVTTHLVFEAKLRVAQPPTTVTFQSDILNRTITVANGIRYDLSEGFDVPPGEHIVTVLTDGSGDVDDSRRKLFVAFDDPHFATIVRTGGFASNP